MGKQAALPEAEDLKPGEELTEDQRKALEEEKDKGWDDEDEPKKKEPEEEEEDPKPKEEDEEPKEEETPEEKEAREKTEAEAKKDEETEAKETERLEKKAEKLKKTVDEVKEIESTEKTEVERIEKTAKDEGITVEEVKENETKDVALSERHGKDPVKVARALRKEQSEYGKLNTEVEELREFKAKAEAHRTQFNEKQFNANMEDNREKVVDTYREKFPEDAGDDVSDDAVFERAKAKVREAIKDREKVNSDAVEEKAETTRKELIDSVPAEYKEHIPAVKKILAECDDLQILEKGFDVVYLADYVRGKKFTPDHVKSLEDAAYKRGVEQPKIIPKLGTPKAGAKKVSADVSKLTADQKLRGEEIYGRREGWTKEQMWEEYAKDLKENKGEDF